MAIRWFSTLFLGLLLSSQAIGQAASRADDTLRLGLMRGVPEKWALEKNFAVFLERLHEAKRAGVELFITPECWLDGYAADDAESTPERLRTIAQELQSSPYLDRVAEEARKLEMFICFGFTSLEDGRVFNAAGLWNTEGELSGLYHKTHLQKHDLQFEYGEALPAWSTPWGTMGMMICADRRWPETARTLRLQGARIILNPTYGFRGDLNTAMMRTRSYENQCFIAFTHPEEGLVTAPGGRIVAQEEGGPGVLVCDIDLTLAKADGHLVDRRPELYASISQGPSEATAMPKRDGPVLRVAAAQMLSTFDVAMNAEKMIAMLEDAKRQGARIVVFPEMALAGFTKRADFLDRLDWAAVDAGIEAIREACAMLGIAAVFGAPTRDESGAYCAAIAIGSSGETLDIYEKIYLAGEKWAKSGRRLSTFSIDGIQCASFVCHDERYAPLVQLRALAGAQLFFYISCESGIRDLHKMNPYRAQVQARAQENRVFIVQANTPAAPNPDGLADTSHGESRIVNPDGNLIAEAPVFGEQLLVADLHLAHANEAGMRAALSSGPLAQWMREGVSLVNAQNPADEGWESMFDGRTFDGWEGDLDVFRIEERAIVGGNLDERIPMNYFLCTTETYGDFEMRLQVRLKGSNPNAGVQIRSARIPGDNEVIGYQADLGQVYWGSIYDESRRRRVIAQADPELIERIVRKDDWNEYRIRCEGDRIQLWLNGEQTVDYREEEPGIPREGIIGLQIHGGQPSEAWYKDIFIRRLDDADRRAALH